MIPRVFPQWTNEQHIMDTFHKQDIGKVYKVDIIRKPDEPGRHYPIYQAFIYFSVWYDNEIAFHFQQRIYNSENKQTKVVYDDPWFWVVFENKSKKNALSKDDKRLIQMEKQLYQAEQRLNEQGQCIQQLQECVLLTTTAMNDSIAAATVASVASVVPMDERQPYPEDDYVQWTEPTGTWDECDDYIQWADPPGTWDECDDKTYRYPARPKSNWYKCDTCCNACDMSACSEHTN